MAGHHSRKRLGAERTFPTSSGGAPVVTVSMNSGIGSRARGRERAKVVEDAGELAIGLDEARDGRPAEVGEDGGVAVAVAGAVEPPAPAGRRLLQTLHREVV